VSGDPEVVIRAATADDAERLAEIGARTFHESFVDDTPPDDMSAYLAQAFGVAQQAAELAEPGALYLLAEVGGEAVGYALLASYPPPDCVRGPSPLVLSRLYSRKAWIGRGVGPRLLAAVIAAALERGARTLWLTVWERNERAKAFYRKQGFVDVGSVPFAIGTDVQTDRVYVLDLEAGGA
jgi:diamine N-acetyltransferase